MAVLLVINILQLDDMALLFGISPDLAVVFGVPALFTILRYASLVITGVLSIWYRPLTVGDRWHCSVLVGASFILAWLWHGWYW